MRFDLKVPFPEKDAAKQLGARWDAARKIWYIEGRDEAPFAKWSPKPHDGALAPAIQPKASPSPKPPQSDGKVYVGSAYVQCPVVCECPPWEVCDSRGLAIAESNHGHADLQDRLRLRGKNMVSA